MRRLSFLSACALAVVITIASGCGSSNDNGVAAVNDGRVTVAASFWPIEEILHQVGGDRVEILQLTSPGAEAHDTEMTAKRLEELAVSAAVVYLGEGFQASVEKAIGDLSPSVAKLDVLNKIVLLDGAAAHGDDDAGGHADDAPGETAEAGAEEVNEVEHEEGFAGGKDPHVWLSPANMVTMTEAVTALLVAVDADNAADYEAGGKAYIAKLNALDAEMRAALSSCSTTTFVTNHRAFGYLADRYGLTQLAISGLSPEDEPSAQELEVIATQAAKAKVTTIFVEANLNPGLAKTLADELGLTTAELQTLESLTSEQQTAGVTYVSAQQENAKAISTALGCTAA